MNASFYDLLKYAATGIASHEMTYFDKMRALSMAGGGTIKTLTGIPPLSFKSDGSPLISWSMKGNGSQSGTPTPDAPIMPEFVGVRTGNLAQSVEQGGITNAGEKTTASIRIRVKADVFPNTTYTFASNKPISIISGFTGETYAHAIISPAGFPTQYTFTTGEDDTVVYVTLRNEDNTTIRPADLSGAMLNSGSTALPYEPYGYKIPITCAGQTVPVYLGQTPTLRIIRKLVLTGDEANWYYYGNATSTVKFFYLVIIRTVGVNLNNLLNTHGFNMDEVAQQSGNILIRVYAVSEGMGTVEEWKSYLAAQYAAGTPVTVWYVLATPTTGIVNEPLAKIGDYADELHSSDASVTIPTANGDNTLTVGTELQPSSMTITGHIE